MNIKKVENLLLGLPAWVLSAVTVSAVMYLTLVPRPLPDMGVSFWEHTDKVVHAIMMAGVVWAVSLDIMRRNRSRVIRLRFPDIVAVCAAVVLFGGAIALAQGTEFIGRGADWADFWADTAGAVIAGMVTWRLPWPYRQC